MQDGNNNEPGWVFKPGDTPSQPAVQPVTPPTPPVSAAPAPAPTPDSAPVPQPTSQPISQTPQPAPVQASQQESVEEFIQDEGYPHVEWTASEYIAHQKSAGWYGTLAVATIGIAALMYFVTRGDIISSVVVFVLGALLGIFAARQPKELTYAINNSGLLVGQKFYPYEAFKTFSVVHNQGIGYISLEPLRRFMPPLTIHYDLNDENRIAGTLAEYLPHEEHKPDIVDDLTRRFRF